MIGAPGEVVLPRRVAVQPTPDIHQGGDCGACVLGGALGLTVPEVYARFESKGVSSHHEMRRLLRCPASYGLADRIIEEPAEWPRDWSGCSSFGRPAYFEYLAWFQYVRMAIDAGYYGLATVDFGRSRGATPHHPIPQTNHWVLICGARQMPLPPGGGVLTGDVLVSCSARSSGMQVEWVEARDFLMNRGGYDILFVRPAK